MIKLVIMKYIECLLKAALRLSRAERSPRPNNSGGSAIETQTRCAGGWKPDSRAKMRGASRLSGLNIEFASWLSFRVSTLIHFSLDG